MEIDKSKNARFDTRLSVEQKEFFERAATLGGYRNLTDFVIKTIQEKADKIIDDQSKLIASQKDREIFFDTLLNPPEPNEELLKAADVYAKYISK